MKRLFAAIAALLLLAFAQPALADSFKAVRATIAADKAAQAQVDAAQTAAAAALADRLKALEDRFAASSIVAPTPTPPPPIPATVAAKGLQTAWNLQFRAAPVTTKNLLDEVAANHILPAGWSFDFVGRVLYITADSDQSGWDLRGVRIYNQGAHTLKLRSSLIGSVAVLDYVIRNGDDGGTVASVMELYGCRIYGKNTAGLLSSWSTVNSSAKAIFRAYDTDWVDADYRFLSAYNAELVRNWFGRAGVQTSPAAHIEQLFVWSDTIANDNLIDASGSPGGGASGNLMAVGGKQTWKGNIFRGAAALGAYVAIQGNTAVSWAMNDNIIEPGLSAANSPIGGIIAKNGGTVTAANGNVAWSTGASIDAAIAQAQ